MGLNLVVTASYFNASDPGVQEIFRAAGIRVTDLTGAGFSPASDPADIARAVGEADAALVGLERYTAEVIRACPRLRMISRCGIGYDSVDSAECSRRGVTLARAAGAVEGAVAEHVMAYILHFARRIDLQNAAMHAGRWEKSLPPGAKTRTLGLVGIGGIGREIALRAKPFGMRILFNCRHPEAVDARGLGAQYAPLPELLAQSDYVSVNVPLTADTRGMFGAERYAQMKQGAVFINISRGPVADQEALAQALESGHLGGAAVDVYDAEPCTDSPLRRCANAVLTPHSASSTEENNRLMSRTAAQNVADWANGCLRSECRVC